MALANHGESQMCCLEAALTYPMPRQGCTTFHLNATLGKGWRIRSNGNSTETMVVLSLGILANNTMPTKRLPTSNLDEISQFYRIFPMHSRSTLPQGQYWRGLLWATCVIFTAKGKTLTRAVL